MSAAPDPALVAQALRAVSAAQGYNAWLGVELLALETGRVELAFAIRPEITQHHGFVHGGVLAAAADTVCSWAAASVAGDVVTSNITVQFLSPAVGDRVRAVGQVLKSGKRQVSIEAKVYAEAAGGEAAGGEAKLVAVALAAITPVG